MDGERVSRCRTLSQTFESDASIEDFWAIYTDATVWHEWTPEIRWATIQGKFEPGATGKCKFKGLPATPYAVGRVDAPRRFVTVMDFRFARIEFDHVLVPTEGGVRVTEEMTFCGLFGTLFWLLQRRRVKRSWPEAMATLTRMAVNRSQQPRSRPAPSPSAAG
jgi:hypothetical protein